MRGKQAAGASALVLAALMMAGCGGASAEPEPTGEATQVDTTEEDAARDVAACEAVSDVMTFVDNADIGVREGRMTAQEQKGWNSVATRALDRIPSSDGGVVGQGVADLKKAAPAVEAGTGAEPVGVRSDAWWSALDTLSAPCLAADAELTIQAFTGG